MLTILKYDIAVQIQSGPSTVDISLNCTSSLPTEIASSVAESLRTAISSIVSSSADSLIDSVQLVGQQAIDTILQWNSTEPVPLTPMRCVHELITDRACRSPSSPALCAWDGNLNYAELDRLSTRLAFLLVASGVTPRSMVPLCFDKSLWAIVSMLAVLKAGATYVPLDAKWPAIRHHQILAQTQAKVVLVSVQYADQFSSDYLPIIVNDKTLTEAASLTIDLPTVSSCDAAYILFTSGTSTGKPKGVVLEHGAVSSACMQFGPTMGISSSSRVLQFS